MQNYWRQISVKRSILACLTANPTPFRRPVVGSASLLFASAIIWRLATHNCRWIPFRTCHPHEQGQQLYTSYHVRCRESSRGCRVLPPRPGAVARPRPFRQCLPAGGAPRLGASTSARLAAAVAVDGSLGDGMTATACVAVGGPTAGRGAAPQLWTAHPRGGPKISRSGPARE